MRASRALWLGASAVILDLMSYYLLGYDVTNITLQVIVLGVAVTVSVGWGPAAIRAFRAGARSAGDKIILSIWAAWTVLVFQRFYALSLTVMDRPTWLIESPISSIVTTLICIAGTYAAYATISEAQIPKQDKTWTLISTGVGCFVAGVFTTFIIMMGLKFN